MLTASKFSLLIISNPASVNIWRGFFITPIYEGYFMSLIFHLLQSIIDDFFL